MSQEFNNHYLSSSQKDHEAFRGNLSAPEGMDVTVGWIAPIIKCQPSDAKGMVFQAFLKYNDGRGKPSSGFTIMRSIESSGVHSDVQAVLLMMFKPGEYDKAFAYLVDTLGYVPDVIPVRPSQ